MTQSIATIPTLIGSSVKNASYVEGVQSGVAAGTYTQTVQVQWTNHASGDLVSANGKVTIKASDCTQVDKLDASASVSVTSPTCTTAAKLVYGAFSNIKWSGTADGTTGPSSYSVTATAVSGHKFADGTASKTFSGNLPGKDLSLCDKVTPVAPTITQATGQCVGTDWTVTKATVVLLDTDKYQYDDYGQDNDGKLELDAGTYTFHVTAKSGTVLQDGNGFVNGSITITIDPLGETDCSDIPTQTVVFVQQGCLPSGNAGGFTRGGIASLAATTTGVFAPGTITIPDVPGIRYEITLKNGDTANIPAGVWYLTMDGTKSGEPYFGSLIINAYPTGVQQLTGTTQWKFTPTDPRPCGLASTGANPAMIGIGVPLAGGLLLLGVVAIFLVRRMR